MIGAGSQRLSFFDTNMRPWTSSANMYLYAQRATGQQVKTLCTDNGGEFISNEFTAYCKESGISRQLTVPYTSSQNPLVEAKNRYMQEGAKALLQQASLSQKFWAEAIQTFTYLQNLLSTEALVEKTPYEYWTGHRPRITHLRVFGSVVYACVPKDLHRKFDNPAQKSVFIGYTEGVKGYKIYDPGSGKVSFARAAKFDKHSTLKHSFENHMNSGSQRSEQKMIEGESWENQDLELSSDEDESVSDAPVQSEEQEDGNLDHPIQGHPQNTSEEGIEPGNLEITENEAQGVQPLRKSSRKHTTSPLEWNEVPYAMEAT